MWQVLTTAPNVPAAHAVTSLMESHGIECRLKTDTAILGEGRACEILVEAARMVRAKQVLADAVFTDDELDFLATGQLSCDDAKELP